MKKQVKSWSIMAMSAIVLTFSSCSKEKDNSPSNDSLQGGAGNILIETTIKNADGASGQSYIRQIPALSGSVDNSNGIQVGFASSIAFEGDDVFVFPEFGPNGRQSIIKYRHYPNGLKKLGELQITPNSYPNNLTSVNSEKAYSPMFNLGRVLIFNPSTMTKTGEIDLTPYAHTDKSVDPSYGIIRDGIYYLALDQIGPNWMPYEDYRQVDVVLIDTKTDKVIKMISEKTSGLCFPTRPFLKGMIFTNEQNDIYIACTGYFGYNPQYVKNGFVCIPAGSQDFDTSRSWDISSTPIEGSQYKASTVYNCQYIGNGKVAAYVGVTELMGKNPYTTRNSMAVIIDLKAKTIKKIDGIPYTDGHSVAIEKNNNQILFSAFGTDAAGIFAYDMNTGKTSQLLTAKGNISFMHIFK